jgi:hypothetical protein
MKKNLLVLIASLFFSFLAAEMIFRVLIYVGTVQYPNPNFEKILHQYSRNRELIYELKPSVCAKTIYGPVKTNRYGLRDNEYSLTRPPNTFRICVIGDSVTFGPNLAVQDTYPKILERMLNSKYGSRKRFEVINFADVGYNSYQEEIVLKEKCLKFHPDLLLIGFCLNDDSYTDGLGGLAREMSPDSLGSRLHSRFASYLLYRFERAHSTSWDDMGKVEHFFNTLSTLSLKENFKVTVLVFPYYFMDIKSYAEIVKHRQVGDIAKRNQLPVIDFMNLWKEVDWPDRKMFYLYNDGIHFSKKGMTRVADAVFRYPQSNGFVDGDRIGTPVEK